jgi:hypothetical protein
MTFFALCFEAKKLLKNDVFFNGCAVGCAVGCAKTLPLPPPELPPVYTFLGCGT